MAFTSLPVRGAWIEIANANGTIDGILSLPVRGAWIEIFFTPLPLIVCKPSLPVRGAWIEIIASNQ